MLDYKIKIGLVPERRYLPGPKRTGIFNPDYAIANKNRVIEYIKKNYTDENTEFCDIDFLNEEGMLYHTDQCDELARHFREKEVDALFIINCNFGNEEAAGKIAQLVGKPVLLWGPRDTVFCEEGTRYTDTAVCLPLANSLKGIMCRFHILKTATLRMKHLTKA